MRWKEMDEPDFEHEEFDVPKDDGWGIYSKEARLSMLDEDQIEGWEAAFMEGWDESAA